MTSDERRREVAEALRGLDVSDLGDGHGIIDTPEEAGALFSRILEAANDYRPGLHYATSHFAARAAVELFADLIDRPTCRMDTDGKRHKSEVFAECKQYVWFCSECGSPIYNDLKPSFCIYCGAKVVGE